MIRRILMERFGKVFKILFIIVSILTVLEYMFVTGMFTSVLCLMLVDIVGVVNVIVSLKEKKFNEAFLYLIASIGISMGYWKLMF
jgi:hypothetical protein